MVCQEYNPYFTLNEFWDDKEIQEWQAKALQGVFNQDLFDKVMAETAGLGPLAGKPTAKVHHYTLIFQVFVFMQIFNQMNARKFHELNIFTGLCRNPIFLLITATAVSVQLLMVQVGGQAVQTTPLTLKENLLCLAIGAGGLIWALFLK